VFAREQSNVCATPNDTYARLRATNRAGNPAS
jgi:hypothetical protein